MSARAGARARAWADQADPVLAASASAAVGIGAVLAVAGAAQDRLTLAIAGAAVAAAGLALLLSAGWVAALPVVVAVLSAPAPYSSDAVRIAPVAVVSALVICAWAIGSTATRRRFDPGDLPMSALAALLLALLLAAVFARERGPALREVVNWAVLLALLFVATDELGNRRDRRASLSLAIAAVVAVTGVAAMLQFGGVLPSRFRWGHGVVRATAGFGWPNELGMFMALGVPFAVYALATSRGWAARALALAGLAATLAGLGATFSRGSWAAVLVGSIPLVFVGRGRLVARIGLGAGLALLLANAASHGAILSRVTSTEDDWVVGQRLALTLSGLQMFREHPLFGVGPGGFGDSLEGFAARIPQLWDLTGSAQNAYVQFAAEMGILGLLAYAGLLVACGRRALRRARAAVLEASTESEATLRVTLLWAMSIVVAIGFFEWPFAHGVAELIVLVLALVCAT